MTLGGDDHPRDQASRRTQLDKAWMDFAEVLLPSLEPAVLDRAAQISGLPAIRPVPVRARIEDERSAIERTVREIDADPAYQARAIQFLKIRTKLEELDAFVTPLEASVCEIEADSDFRELVRLGYGRDEYSGRWWTPSHYRNRSMAEALVARFGPSRDAKDFIALRLACEAERKNLDGLLVSKQALAGERSRLEEMQTRRESAVSALATLEARQLDAVRARVREQLMHLSADDRLKLLLGDPDLELAAKRIAGIESARPSTKPERDAVDAEQISAGLRLDLANTEAFLIELSRALHGQLGERTKLHADGARIISFELNLEPDVFLVKRETHGIVTQHRRVVKGIALKTVTHPLDRWVSLVSKALAAHANESDRVAQIVASFKERDR